MPCDRPITGYAKDCDGGLIVDCQGHPDEDVCPDCEIAHLEARSERLERV